MIIENLKYLISMMKAEDVPGDNPTFEQVRHYMNFYRGEVVFGKISPVVRDKLRHNGCVVEVYPANDCCEEETLVRWM